MAAIHLFEDISFDEHAIRIMGAAFDSACIELGEFGRSDAVHEILAKRIIELAKTGERSGERLCEQALKAAADPTPLKSLVALIESTPPPRTCIPVPRVGGTAESSAIPR
jgi:hypothetical protein